MLHMWSWTICFSGTVTLPRTDSSTSDFDISSLSDITSPSFTVRMSPYGEAIPEGKFFTKFQNFDKKLGAVACNAWVCCNEITKYRFNGRFQEQLSKSGNWNTVGWKMPKFLRKLIGTFHLRIDDRCRLRLPRTTRFWRQYTHWLHAVSEEKEFA